MKPSEFTYHRPRSLDEALDVLAGLGERGKVLAGGQSLVPLMSMRLSAPEHLVDVNHVPGLDFVRVDADAVHVGALARHSRVEHDAAAYDAVPLLRRALRQVAHPTIRNRGTTVGSLVHADPAAEMPAVLLLLDGSVTLRSPTGPARCRRPTFFTGPMECAARAGELAVSATFRRPPPGSGSAFVEVARRQGDYAVCGVGAVVGADTVRVALVEHGGRPGAGRPVRRLRRRARSTPALARDLVDDTIDPEGDIHASADYRRHLAHVLVARAVARGAGGGGRGMSDDVVRVSFTVNGAPYDLDLPPRRLLSDALRHDLRLTGTHVGCEHGVCGACTVLVDGAPMRSCLLFAVSLDGAAITTTEGLRSADGGMGPVQQAFHECHALQCGFCTPGFVTTVAAFLETNPDPTPAEAREAISGNLCRCTGYVNIVAAVCRAAELLSEGPADAATPEDGGRP